MKYITTTLVGLLCLVSIQTFAQNTVEVTFRYTASEAAQRVFVPGEFNNWGSNTNGVIAINDVSLMQYDGFYGFWFKKVALTVDGGTNDIDGQSGYAYKFHEHLNASGSSFSWLSDPLNPFTVGPNSDSFIRVTHPMVFQMEPAENSVHQIVVPEFWANVATIASDSIDISASEVYVNDVFVTTFEGYFDANRQFLRIADITQAGGTLTNGSNEFKIKAVTLAGEVKMDSTTFSYVSEIEPILQPRPSTLKDGITYGGNSAYLSLFAPHKKNVYVIGDFNNWSINANYLMRKDSVSADSVWFWLRVDGLTQGQEYGFQYLVDGEIRVTDPYAELVLDANNDQYISETVYPGLKEYPAGKTNNLVGLLRPGKTEYQWEATEYMRPENDDLVIYELLIRDFIEDHSYETLIDTLDYLENLGITAIELLPVNEFDGNDSWGYNPALHLALDKYYGSPDAFKRFVDEAHKRGIAVILDVVLNHAFGQNPLVRLWNEGDYGTPTAENPYFNQNATHPYNVGYDFNHESAATKYYSKRVMEYWLDEYNIDGYRFDLSKGFTQVNNPEDIGGWSSYDASRIAIWKEYFDYIRSVDETAYVILEHFADNSEEIELTNYGMMVWGNENHQYNEATMGYASNLSNVMSTYRNHTYRHLVGFMESHDEQWLMFKNISFGACANFPAGGDGCITNPGEYNVRDLGTALDRMELAGAFFLTLPGPKMIWQFGELGYGYGDAGEQCLNDSADCPAIAPGRTDRKPIRWDYYNNSDRKDLYDAWSAMLKLRASSPVFTRPQDSFFALSGSLKYFRMMHEDADVVAIGNFGVSTSSVTPDFTQDGVWYDYFGNSTLNVSGGQATFDLAPGAFKIFTTKQFGTITSNEDEVVAEGPTSFKLYHNYPNPFNPSTTLTFDVAQAGQVTLEIFNSLGQKVAVLLNENKSIGTHSVTFDASTLSSGVYIARFSGNGFVQTQKMMLLK